MTASAHTTAMQARIEHDELDSSYPLDFDPERGDEWRLPEVKPWAPKPSFWAKVNAWLGGAS